VDHSLQNDQLTEKETYSRLQVYLSLQASIVKEDPDHAIPTSKPNNTHRLRLSVSKKLLLANLAIIHLAFCQYSDPLNSRIEDLHDNDDNDNH
jgi:hypothetical protein